ncbi:MAG: Holliday junction branch migration protein RuvA [Clostridiales bacterium]|jgi:Holliday junction DNA helicase RuvA|nr:Holliday junction branch migration protein RuvA [Clostridiales bacterium]
MFYYLKGEITHKDSGFTVIDVGGVGYKCSVSLNTLSKLGIGAKTTLYTHMYVREDLQELYGFSDTEELNCFKMLIGISGVGPKAALSVLSAITPQQLALSVATGDEKPLLTAQGIGKKLAMRIILELKDKISSEQSVSAGVSYVPISDSAGEASAALAVLGYSRDEISAALKGVDTANLTVEEIVRSALKGLMKP